MRTKAVDIELCDLHRCGVVGIIIEIGPERVLYFLGVILRLIRVGVGADGI